MATAASTPYTGMNALRSRAEPTPGITVHGSSKSESQRGSGAAGLPSSASHSVRGLIHPHTTRPKLYTNDIQDHPRYNNVWLISWG